MLIRYCSAMTLSSCCWTHLSSSEAKQLLRCVLCLVSVFLWAVTRWLRRNNKTSCLVAWLCLFPNSKSTDMRTCKCCSLGFLWWDYCHHWASRWICCDGSDCFSSLGGLVLCVRLMYRTGEHAVAQVQDWLEAVVYFLPSYLSSCCHKWFSFGCANHSEHLSEHI